MTSNKTSFILLCLFLFCSSSLLAKSNTTQSDRPNIVFIICDDLNDAIHGMGGHPQAKTPGIDKLVTKGVQFTNAQTNCPLCGPSRASLWSGLYPHTTGYFGYKQQMNHWRKNPVLKDAVTVFEHLSGNGYKVYATGKIHHNGHEDKSIFINEDGESGFKVEASFGPYPWDGDPAKTIEKTRGVKHPDFPKSLENEHWANSFGPIRNLSNEINGKGTWLYTHNAKEYKYKNETERDLMPDERCVEYAKQILQSAHDKPFMLSIGFNRPHSPHYVPEKYFDLFPLETLKLAPYLVHR